MPAAKSIERRIVMLAFGAELHLTDPTMGYKEVLRKGEEILKVTPNGYMLHQFENPANPRVFFQSVFVICLAGSKRFRNHFIFIYTDSL
jgi:cysteine synthase A